MEKDLESSIIKATQSSLGKFVKRPQLSEKLLKKPPFRFLHDIITSVLKSTNFFGGLFEEEELISDNVKDRESKILFLTKVITVLGYATGTSLLAKPSKIVAGQEPEKTNELLQCLAQALEKKLSSDDAVRKYKENVQTSQTVETKVKETSKTVKKNADTRNLTSRSNEKLVSQKKETSLNKDLSKEKVSKAKDRTSTKQDTPPKPVAQKTKTIINKKLVNENGNQQNSKQSMKTLEKEKVKSFAKQDAKISKNSQELDVPDNVSNKELDIPHKDEQKKTADTITENFLNSSLSSQDLMETEKSNGINQNAEPSIDVATEQYKDLLVNTESSQIEPLELLQKQSSVEKTDSNILNSEQDKVLKEAQINNQDVIMNVNKPEKVSNIVRPQSVRPSSSRPGAPRLRDKNDSITQGSDNLLVGKVNIIVESTQNEEEDESSIIIIEQQAKHTPDEHAEQFQLASNQHGHLVQQILDSQKEFSQITGKTEIEWQFGAQKAREASNQEIEQLRFNIQGLSHAANPLGKLLDHIQEDVEVMRQEYV